MKRLSLFLALSLALSACAPRIQNEISGIVTAAYLATPFEIVAALASASREVQPSGDYTFLAAEEVTDTGIVLSAELLKSADLLSVMQNPAETITVSVTAEDRGGWVLVSFQARPANDRLARETRDALRDHLNQSFVIYNLDEPLN